MTSSHTERRPPLHEVRADERGVHTRAPGTDGGDAIAKHDVTSGRGPD